MSSEQDITPVVPASVDATIVANAAPVSLDVTQPGDEVATIEQPASEPVSLPEQTPTTPALPDSTIEAAQSAHVDDDGLPSSTVVVEGVVDGNGDQSQDFKKKDGKRRSSAVPEHKSKKLNKRKSIVTMQLDAQPGDYYWAKLKGHPSWPSVIADEEMLPENMLRSRPVTAKDASGHYRDDYKNDGKNAKGRTYPIMYLGSNEFSWILNTDLTPLNPEDLDIQTSKKSKALQNAYDTARERSDLSHYKKMLHDHQQAIQDEYARQQALEAEKAAKKEKKSKRKSKDAVDNDGDVDMDDVDGGAGADTKSSKKRKKESIGKDDQGKLTKTPKKIKVTMPQAVNGEPTSKPKTKSKAKARADNDDTPVEPKMTPEQIREKQEKAIYYYRHKLQKGFMSRDSPPKDDEMKQMSEYFSELESYKDLETGLIKKTKIHKVLKAIVKLAHIPRDDEFHFKIRALNLLEPWQKALAEDAVMSGKAGVADVTDGLATTKDEKPENEEPGDHDDASAEHKLETAGSSEPKDAPLDTGTATAPVETVVSGADVPGQLPTKQADDPMADAKTEAALTEMTVNDTPADAAMSGGKSQTGVVAP